MRTVPVEWVWFTTHHQEKWLPPGLTQPLELGLLLPIPVEGWVHPMKPRVNGRDGSGCCWGADKLLFPQLEWSILKSGMHSPENVSGLFNEALEPNEGWGKENPKGTGQENLNYLQLSPSYSLKLPARAEHQLSICWDAGSINLCRVGFMENVPNFLNPQLFQMSSIADRIFSKGFSNSVWSLQLSPLQLRSRETSFPITNFSINNRNYCTQCLPRQLELKEKQRLQLSW